MAETKEKLIRVLQIIQETDEKSPMNAPQIIDALSNRFGIENVDRRSIYKDMLLLESCGYKIVRCKNKRDGWYLKEHPFDDWEIKLMMDSIMQAKCITSEDASVMKKKLLALSSKRGRKRFMSMIIPESDERSKDEFSKQYIDMMLEAMFLKRKIKFQYTYLSADMKPELRKQGKMYQLNLYTLWWSGNTFYLIGSHDDHEGLTKYRLDRIRNLTISDEKMIPAREKLGDNAENIIKEYIVQSVNHYAGEMISLILEYEPNQTNNAILYDFAGLDGHITKISEDCYQIRMRKMNSVTLIGWLLQYADRLRVVAPDCVRDEVVKNGIGEILIRIFLYISSYVAILRHMKCYNKNNINSLLQRGDFYVEHGCNLRGFLSISTKC